MLNRIAAALSLSVVCMTGQADEVKPVTAGKPAPEFTVTGIDGKTFQLSDKLAKGKKNVCLMFSRASW